MNIITEFKNQFFIPFEIRENPEFIKLIDGLNRFSGNRIDKELKTSLLFIGEMHKNNKEIMQSYKLFICGSAGQGYEIEFYADNDELQTNKHEFVKLVFKSYMQEPTTDYPAKKMVVVEKYKNDNVYLADYYKSDLDDKTKPIWVARGVINIVSRHSYNHALIIKDEKKQGYIIQSIGSHSREMQLNKIIGIEVSGEKFLGKEGCELSSKDIISIFKIIKKHKQIRLGKSEYDPDLYK